MRGLSIPQNLGVRSVVVVLVRKMARRLEHNNLIGEFIYFNHDTVIGIGGE